MDGSNRDRPHHVYTKRCNAVRTLYTQLHPLTCAQRFSTVRFRDHTVATARNVHVGSADSMGMLQQVVQQENHLGVVFGPHYKSAAETPHVFSHRCDVVTPEGCFQDEKK